MTRDAGSDTDVRLLGVALVAYTLSALYVYGFTLDDAAITLRYSYNLAHSGVLSFNVDKHVYGTTTLEGVRRTMQWLTEGGQ